MGDGNTKPGDTLTMHALSCPSLTSGACGCTPHTVTITGPLHTEPEPPKVTIIWGHDGTTGGNDDPNG